MMTMKVLVEAMEKSAADGAYPATVIVTNEDFTELRKHAINYADTDGPYFWLNNTKICPQLVRAGKILDLTQEGKEGDV